MINYFFGFWLICEAIMILFSFILDIDDKIKGIMLFTVLFTMVEAGAFLLSI